MSGGSAKEPTFPKTPARPNHHGVQERSKTGTPALAVKTHDHQRLSSSEVETPPNNKVLGAAGTLYLSLSSFRV